MGWIKKAETLRFRLFKEEGNGTTMNNSSKKLGKDKNLNSQDQKCRNKKEPRRTEALSLVCVCVFPDFLLGR